MQYLENAYQLDPTLLEAAANAIYLRFSVCNWGYKGEQYRKDIATLTSIVRKEMTTSFLDIDSINQASVVHPHMALGYAINPDLKLAISRSHARAEGVLVTRNNLFPYNDTSKSAHSKLVAASTKPGYRIKIGYASANIKAKTTAYMAQVRAECE